MADGEMLYGDFHSGKEDLLTHLLKRLRELEGNEGIRRDIINTLNQQVSMFEKQISSLKTLGHETAVYKEAVVTEKTNLHLKDERNKKAFSERKIATRPIEELCERSNEKISIEDFQETNVLSTPIPANCTKKENDTLQEDNITVSGGILKKHVSTGKPDVLANDPHKCSANKGESCYKTHFEKVLSGSEEKKYLPNFEVWTTRANEEAHSATQSLLNQYAQMQGLKTVFCLDTSSSMSEGNCWIQLKSFVSDYLNGLERHAPQCHNQNELVALAIFGNDTKVAQRFTNDYQKIHHTLQYLKPEGPSPMYGGLAMAIAAAVSPPYAIEQVNGRIEMPTTKIVLITDGHATESNLYQGPDEVNPQYTDETNAHIIGKLGEISRRQLDFYILPIGNANSQLIEFMVAVTDGKLLKPSEGRTFANRSSSSTDISESAPDCYNEINDKHIPVVGSRVVRGPDWNKDDCNGNGPGTIIGHFSDSKVFVEWDLNANIGSYRYSDKHGYNVLLIDQTRELTGDIGKTIAVGCLVKPGSDLNYESQHVSSKERGIVIKVLAPEEDMVHVRWRNFKRARGEYSYGHDNIYEVELCREIKTENDLFFKDGGVEIKRVRKLKNKNLLPANK